MTETTPGLVTDSSRLVRVLTDEFGLSLFDLRRLHREVMWGSHVTEEFIATLGYAVVHPRAPDFEGRAVEVTPELIDGIYHQAWELSPVTEVEVEVAFSAQRSNCEQMVKNYVEESIARGALFNFGTETDNFLSVQIRDQDRLNILGLITKSEREPNLVQVFRTAENIMVPITGEQLVALSDLAYLAYTSIKGAEWKLLDKIRAATTEAELPAMPESFRDFYETHAGLTWAAQTA